MKSLIPRIVWSRRKTGKVILEFEVATDWPPDVGPPVYIIGKIYRGDRGRPGFDALSQLWLSGFRPPSPFTVVCPIVYLPDRYLLLQEKAPGRMLADILFAEPDAAQYPAVAGAATWLGTLHSHALQVPSRLEQVKMLATRYGTELAQLLPEQRPRVECLVWHALTQLAADGVTALVPSHGDFHPKNVFIAADGRVTAIDLDTFASQEPAADVGYFLVQTAVMGYRHLGSFAATAEVRSHFLRAYGNAAPTPPADRLALYLGLGFLQSLYYELCILQTGNVAIVKPWLTNAERTLLDGEVSIA